MFFLEVFDLGDSVFELGNSACALEILDSFGGSATEVELVFFQLSSVSVTFGSAENVSEFLLREVYVIVSVRMRVLGWVPPVILIPTVTPEVLAVGPGLQLQIAHRTVLVVVAD